MNLPNKLTLGRLILIPFFVLAFSLNFTGHYLVALALFGIAAFTDFLDGHIARKYNLVTDLGKFLDPIADKVLVLVALAIMLADPKHTNLFFQFGAWGFICGGIGVSIIIAREMAVSSLRMLAAKNGKVLAGTVFFITLGGVAQFVQYSRKFAGPINEFANILHEFQSAFSAAERVFRILDEEPEREDESDAMELKEISGFVEMDDVTFGYVPDKTILKNVSVTAMPGKTVAIVGPTGAGKTTVINLLMRFYDPQSGEIRLDSIPSLKIKREDLRKAYTMVLQDTWLFTPTPFRPLDTSTST